MYVSCIPKNSFTCSRMAPKHFRRFQCYVGNNDCLLRIDDGVGWLSLTGTAELIAQSLLK